MSTDAWSPAPYETFQAARRQSFGGTIRLGTGVLVPFRDQKGA